ncbi:MAG: hypothetical protein NXI15_08495 [Gammaproteobacteria bacterium]|nr:hypothetical protein [Gammaproteobacteria bacterium]
MKRLAGLLIVVLTATAATAAAEKLYRYRNAEGNVVVDYRVPAEYVSGGYEVINDEGVVLEIVPRELTPEEKKAAEIQRKLEEEARAEEERLRQWDESLLLRYSTSADIEAARERALDNLRIRMSILKGNRRSLKQKIENYQAQAAEIERSGREVDKKRLQAISDMQQEIGATERAIADRQREMEELAESFQMDIERFEQLQDMVDLRRTHGEKP